MVSCTEFIPLYSELFQYIDDKAGHDAVVRYWEHISDVYVVSTLGAALDKFGGLDGCWAYWSHTLTEEAADFWRVYDDEKQISWSVMRHCPSRGMLNELTHMTPYYDYCGHCNVLYSRVLEPRGIHSWRDNSRVSEAMCRSMLYCGEMPEKLPEFDGRPEDY